MTTMKRNRSDLDDGIELEEDKNPFFDLLVGKGVSDPNSMEKVFQVAYQYGLAHGEKLRRRLDQVSSPYVYHGTKLTGGTRRRPRNTLNPASERLNYDNLLDSYAVEKTTIASPSGSREASSVHHNGNSRRSTKRVDTCTSSKASSKKISSQSSETTNKVNESSRSAKPLSEVSWSPPLPLPPPSCPHPTFKGVEVPSGPDQSVNTLGYQAFVEIYNKKIRLGSFPRDREAALAHDRALIRAIGPVNCPHEALNMPISSYAKDTFETFTRFDGILKRELVGVSEWCGLKDCDFSFLITRQLKVTKKTKQHLKNALRYDMKQQNQFEQEEMYFSIS